MESIEPRLLKRFFAAFAAAALLVPVFTLAAQAAGGEKTADVFRDPNGRLMSAARMGDWRNYPENSAAGIRSCIAMGVDIIEVDVRKAADGTMMLFKDDDLSRTCVGPDGKVAEGKVSQKTASELNALNLRQGQGGVNMPATPYNPTTLREAVAACKGQAMLMLDADWALRDDIYDELKEAGAMSTAVFRFDAKAKELAEWVLEKNPMPQAMGYYKGNVVFLATRAADICIDNRLPAVEYATGNTYSVLFNQFTLGRFKGESRLFISTADKKLCGGREDNSAGWDDLVSRGYSVIETDYPQDLVDYIKETGKSREKLEQTVREAEKIESKKYSGKSVEALNESLEQAGELLEKGSASKNQLENACYDLRQKTELLEGANGTLPKGRPVITSGRITAAVLCSLGVLAAQIYTFKKTRRKESRSTLTGVETDGKEYENKP